MLFRSCQCTSGSQDLWRASLVRGAMGEIGAYMHVPLGNKWNANVLLTFSGPMGTTIVCPALFPPAHRAHISKSAERMSTSLPLPSSPHCEPSTTVAVRAPHRQRQARPHTRRATHQSWSPASRGTLRCLVGEIECDVAVGAIRSCGDLNELRAVQQP